MSIPPNILRAPFADNLLTNPLRHLELPLGPDPRTETLRIMQDRLIARYGRIEREAAGRNPVWTLVQGVIGARTKSEVSNMAADRLLAHYGSWEAVAKADLDELTAILSTQTFPGIAAQRLKACLMIIAEQRGAVDLRHLSNMSTEDAMRWLETLPGVARKISAGTVNASSLARKAVVIDGHHRRIAQRMGLVPARADTTRTHEALTPIIPDEWSAADLDEHHLLVKKLGQTLCRPSVPDCDACPMVDLCETGSTHAA